jgi:hypothetical protein
VVLTAWLVAAQVDMLSQEAACALKVALKMKMVMLQAVLKAASMSGARLPRLVMAMLVVALAMPTSLLRVR